MPGDNGETEAGGEGAFVAVAAPRVMEIPVPGLPPFDTMDEPNTLWLKWKKMDKVIQFASCGKRCG